MNTLIKGNKGDNKIISTKKSPADYRASERFYKHFRRGLRLVLLKIFLDIETEEEISKKNVKMILRSSYYSDTKNRQELLKMKSTCQSL